MSLSHSSTERESAFVPTLPRDDDQDVAFTLCDVDAKPMKQLGMITVKVGGPTMLIDTSPSFGLRVVCLFKSK